MLNFLLTFYACLLGIAFAGYLVGQIALLTLDDSTVQLFCSNHPTLSLCK